MRTINEFTVIRTKRIYKANRVSIVCRRGAANIVASKGPKAFIRCNMLSYLDVVSTSAHLFM